MFVDQMLLHLLALLVDEYFCRLAMLRWPKFSIKNPPLHFVEYIYSLSECVATGIQYKVAAPNVVAGAPCHS